jgi:anti-sigma-K factor RskA
MIDERHEELAALYAFDLLEDAEKAAFEAALARDAELRQLVRELRESSATLAHTAGGVAVPPELKTRLLAKIGASSEASGGGKLLAFPSWIPWAAAACFALIALGAGQFYLTSRSEAEALRDQRALVEATLKSTENLLEAERIVARQERSTLSQQIADASRQLAETRTALDETNRRKAEADAAASTAQRLLAEAGLRAQATERLLANTRAELADIGAQLKLQGDIANLKITTLASMLNNSPQALAVAVWNPVSQHGVLKVEKLPALAADRTYQLWVVDPQYPDPVDGGTFNVDPKTGEARVVFAAKQPIKAIKAYAITQEQKGGVTKSSNPFILLGQEF